MSPDGRIIGLDGRPRSVKNFCSYSLKRLGVEVIDLYQPGRADPEVPYEDTIGAIAELIAEGKVRYLGVSEVGADLLRRAHAVHPVTALEIEYPWPLASSNPKSCLRHARSAWASSRIGSSRRAC